MNNIIVNLKTGNPYKSGSAINLNINGTQQLQLGFNVEDYVRTRGIFNLDAAEYAYFTSVIYGCDRAVNRENSPNDRWTREYAVRIPVTDPEKWSAALNVIEPMLEFLTGDIWHLDFVSSPVPLFGRKFQKTRSNFHRCTRVNGSAVSLFSGGLDSLIGVINWLAENRNESIILASTYDPQAEPSRVEQDRVLPLLVETYPGRTQHYVARTGFCVGGEDTNFRSRSLAFIGNAVLAASFIGNGTPIIIPENGAIALNYPLTPARRGSLSTRTVHPHFIKMLNKLLERLGLNYPLRNPYLLKTKGQMMQECRNTALLRTTYSNSASCGKRGHKECWEDRHARQCGACVPCIFRRAAIHSVGFPTERYGYSLAPESAVQRILSRAQNDLPSVIDFLKRNDDSDAIWRTLKSNGHIDPSKKGQYTSLIEQLRDEVKTWANSMELL